MCFRERAQGIGEKLVESKCVQVWTNADSYGTVSVYYFPTEEDDEDGPTFKDKALEVILKGIDIFCVWDCCWLWLKFQEFVSLIVFDPFVELFITLCIVVNTMFMAMDHHDMNKEMEKVLKSGNYVSTTNYQQIIILIVFVMELCDCHSNYLQVLHRNVCDRGHHETDGHEPQILFPRGLEHLWLHNCGSFVTGAGFGRRTGTLCSKKFSLGKKHFHFYFHFTLENPIHLITPCCNCKIHSNKTASYYKLYKIWLISGIIWKYSVNRSKLDALRVGFGVGAKGRVGGRRVDSFFEWCNHNYSCVSSNWPNRGQHWIYWYPSWAALWAH